MKPLVIFGSERKYVPVVDENGDLVAYRPTDATPPPPPPTNDAAPRPRRRKKRNAVFVVESKGKHSVVPCRPDTPPPLVQGSDKDEKEEEKRATKVAFERNSVSKLLDDLSHKYAASKLPTRETIRRRASERLSRRLENENLNRDEERPGRDDPVLVYRRASPSKSAPITVLDKNFGYNPYGSTTSSYWSSSPRSLAPPPPPPPPPPGEIVCAVCGFPYCICGFGIPSFETFDGGPPAFGRAAPPQPEEEEYSMSSAYYPPPPPPPISYPPYYPSYSYTPYYSSYYDARSGSGRYCHCERNNQRASSSRSWSGEGKATSQQSKKKKARELEDQKTSRSRDSSSSSTSYSEYFNINKDKNKSKNRNSNDNRMTRSRSLPVVYFRQIFTERNESCTKGSPQDGYFKLASPGRKRPQSPARDESVSQSPEVPPPIIAEEPKFSVASRISSPKASLVEAPPPPFYNCRELSCAPLVIRAKCAAPMISQSPCIAPCSDAYYPRPVRQFIPRLNDYSCPGNREDDLAARAWTNDCSEDRSSPLHNLVRGDPCRSGVVRRFVGRPSKACEVCARLPCVCCLRCVCYPCICPASGVASCPTCFLNPCACRASGPSRSSRSSWRTLLETEEELLRRLVGRVRQVDSRSSTAKRQIDQMKRLYETRTSKTNDVAGDVGKLKGENKNLAELREKLEEEREKLRKVITECDC